MRYFLSVLLPSDINYYCSTGIKDKYICIFPSKEGTTITYKTITTTPKTEIEKDAFLSSLLFILPTFLKIKKVDKGLDKFLLRLLLS